MAVSTSALRIGAVLGVLFCLHNSASANLVITFYQQDDDVWMSLSGSGTVPTGIGTAPDATMDFLNFEGNPFPGVSDSPYTFSDNTLNLNVNGGGGANYAITSVTMTNEGTGLSDLSLMAPGVSIDEGNTYTFSGAARVVGLTLDQLALGTYLAQGGTDDTGDQDAFSPVALLVSTPEPASLALMGVGALGLYVSGRRRRKHRPAPAPDDPAPLV